MNILEFTKKKFSNWAIITVSLSLPMFTFAQEAPLKGAINKEIYRPQIHFTPQFGWMNDPNGLVYYKGEYHLFYQYYPDSTVWGPMHWGHAITKDLVHWERLPIALYPDSLGYIFSGSAVMDLDNTSGLGTSDKPAMVAIYTYHNPVMEKAGKIDFESQGIAYSLDNGRTWIKYAGNPVINNPGMRDFRDPKVSWNAATNKWIMVLAAGDRVRFYSSPDILNWTFESEFGQDSGAHGGVWECPDLFPMQTGKEIKWVLIVNIGTGGPNGGSCTQYFIGKFDGHKFEPTNKENRWIDYGKDNYAGVTWSNIQDGRTLFIGWMSNWQYAQSVPTLGWRSTTTFPRELTLIRDSSEYILSSHPVKELKIIKVDSLSLKDFTVTNTKDVSSKIKGKLSPAEIRLTFELPENTSLNPEKIGLLLKNSLDEELKIGYNISEGIIYLDRNNSGKTDFSKDFSVPITAPCKFSNHEFTLDLILDETSLELFAQDGRTVMTNIFFPNKDYDKLLIYTDQGTVKVKEFKFIRLSSIW